MTKRGDKRMEKKEFLERLQIVDINNPTEDFENK